MRVKIKSLKKLQCFSLLFLSVLAYGSDGLKIKLDKITEIGNKTPVFQNVKAVCEDNNGNIYVLDNRIYKVYKFSPDGKLLLTFGQRGEGPGDMKLPHDIYVLSDGKIVLTESQSIVSIFSPDGKIIDKINFQSKLGFVLNLELIGTNLFYAMKYTSDGGNKEQIIFDKNGKKIDLPLFYSPSNLIQVQLEKGFQVFGIPFIELDSYFIFSQYKDHSAIALSRKYEIIILDSQGQMVSKIKQDMPMKKLSPLEMKYRDSILKEKNWPPDIKRKILEIMPESKNYFCHILLSSSFVFAFRVPEDISKEKKEYPVDVFTLNGKYVGSLKMENIPYLISDQFLYMLEENEDSDDNAYTLIKYRYKIEK